MKRLISLMAGLLCVTILVIPATGQQSVYIETVETVKDLTGIFAKENRSREFEVLRLELEARKRGEEWPDVPLPASEFGMQFSKSLAEAITKRNVPVSIAADEAGALWRIKTVITEENDTFARTARAVRAGEIKLPEFSYSIKVVDGETGDIVYDFSAKKKTSENPRDSEMAGMFNSAADDFAKKFKDHLEKK